MSKTLSKKQQREKYKNTAELILKIVGMTALVGSVMVFPGLAYVVKWVEDSLKDNSPKTRRSFKRLQQRGMITLKKEGKKIRLVLTAKGRRQLAEYQLKNLKIKKPGQWDGKWRFVMFDIPELTRYLRNNIRRKLYELGFVPIQKSVFIYPYACKEVVDFMREYYKLGEGQLCIFEGKVLEGETALLKHFKL